MALTINMWIVPEYYAAKVERNERRIGVAEFISLAKYRNFRSRVLQLP
ncbi:hypothetical protein [Pelagibacterium halotolerans]